MTAVKERVEVAAVALDSQHTRSIRFAFLRGRIAHRVYALLAVLGIAVGSAGPAFADTNPVTVDTGTSTTATDGFSALQSFITGSLGLAAVSLVVAGVAISLGIKWMKRMGKGAA